MLPTSVALKSASRSIRLGYAVALTALLASVATLILSGVFGLFLKVRPGGAPDVIWMYAGGHCWLRGFDPYNAHEINAAVQSVQPYDNTGAFGYPPQSAALFVPLASLSWPNAKLCWTILQLVALAVIVAVSFFTLRKRLPDQHLMWLGALLLTAFILGNSNTVYIVWDGQSSLIFLAAGMAAWHLARHGMYAAAGVALAVASMKPQESLFIFLWFALEHRWKTLLYAVGSIVAFSAYPSLRSGFPGVFQDWMRGLRTYEQINTMQNLQSLLISAGIPCPNLTLAGVALVIVLWLFRHKFVEDDALGILLALQLLTLVTHIYDYVGIFPLLASLWIYASQEKRLWLPAIAIFLLFNLPLRVLTLVHSDVLFNWRVIVVAVMLSMVVYLSFRFCSTSLTLEPRPSG